LKIEPTAFAASERKAVTVYQLVSAQRRIARMTRAALYARISKGDQKSLAVAAQVDNLRRFAAAHDYEIVREYEDDGRSAYSGKVRPGFLELLLGIGGREFDVILAVADDRLARNDADGYALRSACVNHGVRWHTISGGETDPSDASGSLLAQVTLAIAEYESAVKAERIRRSVADRLARGEDLMGPRRLGFEKDRKTIRESEAAVIRAGYAMVLEGASVYAVAKMFTERGVKRDRASAAAWRPQTVRHILLNERNVGRLVVRGEVYAEGLSSIVDVDTFEKVRAILTNPDRAPRRGPKPMTWAAIGTVRCGVCGSYLNQTGAARNGRRSLRCAVDSRPIETRGQRHPTMDAIALDAALSALVRVAATPRTLSSPPASPKPVAALQMQVAELVRRRDVAQELAMTPGANVPSAMREISKLGAEIEAARERLDAALASDVTAAAVDAALAVMVARDQDEEDPSAAWDSYWSGLTVEDRRALVLGLGLRPRLHLSTAPARLTPS
jgi:site-specific DNA recombinase